MNQKNSEHSAKSLEHIAASFNCLALVFVVFSLGRHMYCILLSGRPYCAVVFGGLHVGTLLMKQVHESI